MENINNEKESLNLFSVAEIFYKNKIKIVFFSLAVSMAALIYSFTMKEVYLSEALIMSSESSQSNSLLDRYSSLARLGGINLQTLAPSNRLEEAIATLKSREFVLDIINKRKLDKILLASNKWDKEKDEIVFNENIYDTKTEKWKPDYFGPSGKPTNRQLYDAFSRRLTIFKDLETRFVTLGFKSLSPRISKEILEGIIFEVNNSLRSKDIEYAKSSISYVESQLGKAITIDLKNIFYQMIAEQTKTIMLAQGQDDYIFKVIDPPFSPEKRISPDRSLIVGTAFLLSFFLAMIYFISLSFLKKKIIFSNKLPFFKLINEYK